MRSAASRRYLWKLPIIYLVVHMLDGVSGRSDRSAGVGTEILLPTPPGRERAVLLVGQMSGQLIAFDAWTGEIINSIDSGGALVTNCRNDIMQDLHPDGSTTTSLQSTTTRQQTRVTTTSLQTTTTEAFDQHNFAPTMDGRLYHISKHDGEWKEVLLSTSQLLQAKKPVRAKGNPELENVVFVAEKKQRLYTFDADTGQMYPFFSADAAAAAATGPSSTGEQSTVLMGRVDVTTKMVNLHDVLDYKCVTVSEYFIQFAATAQCNLDTDDENSGPWIELEVLAESNVVSLAGYDPSSRRILWKWNSHVDLTMVYGVLPKQGVKFFQWNVTSGLDHATTQTIDDDDEVPSSCPTPPPLIPTTTSPPRDPTSSAVTVSRSPRPNLLYRHIDGQPYLLPSPTEASSKHAASLPNGTNSVVVKRHQQQRPWNFKTVEIDGEKGVVLTSTHVAGIVLAVAVVVMLVAYVFYRKGLIAKPEPHDDVPPSPLPATPPSTPVLSPRPEPESSPKSPISAGSPKSPSLHRHKTGLEHLLRMASPAKMHRSLSFGGFSHAPPPHRPNAHHHPHNNGTSPKAEWKQPPVLRLSDLNADDSGEDSTQSGGVDVAVTPTLSPSTTLSQPVTSAATEEFSKILPYICRGRFANEFEELSTLGKGGFGQVMLAENRLDGRQYAVKRIGLSLRNQTKPTLEKAWLEELGEDEVVPAMSDAASYMTTRTRRYGPTSSVYSARNILQHRSSGEASFDEDGADSLYAPRHRFRSHRDDDGDENGDDDNDDDGGFTWDRGEDNESMEQWSEQDLYDDTVSAARQLESTASTRRHQRRHSTTGTNAGATRIDHWLYIQMQYCSEQCLADVLLAPGRRNYSHMLEMFYQIASALEHVHSLGLIHRDLKPQNIFVMDSDTIKLGDFGLSRYAGSPPSSSETASHDPPISLAKQDESSTWSVEDEKTAGVGTYLYASPEQISGETYNAKADLYSLGLILFEMMHEPFGTTMERVVTLRNLRDGHLPSATWLHDHPPVVAMVLSLVTACPSDRPTAFDVVAWCQTQLHMKSTKNGVVGSLLSGGNSHHLHQNATHDENVHVLQVEAVEWDNSTVCHNLLLALCDVVRAMTSVVIVACGLKQHLSHGQVLEFTLHVETNQVLAQVQDAIVAFEGVKHVELLS
ncbi:hypothetical protein DYB38_002035 [Aphanomyces astaci]|uniref:non-specific serine/threonine protein kinase n=1 Tax=Aphanomyces astaci TaxID=112090 RepID=A0A397CX46_APHAT|nr:hypothetical protein DYB38_002035 [Aphanomyces astaci]